jgi:hypothetical protein
MLLQGLEDVVRGGGVTNIWFSNFSEERTNKRRDREEDKVNTLYKEKRDVM